MKTTAPGSQASVLRLRYGVKRRRSACADRGKKSCPRSIGLERRSSRAAYLVGDSLTVADLTAAALLFPLVRPPEAPTWSRACCRPASSASATRLRTAAVSSGSRDLPRAPRHVGRHRRLGLGLDRVRPSGASAAASRILMTRAGTPATTAFAGTSLPDDAVAPMIELSPIDTPRKDLRAVADPERCCRRARLACRSPVRGSGPRPR